MRGRESEGKVKRESRKGKESARKRVRLKNREGSYGIKREFNRDRKTNKEREKF